MTHSAELNELAKALAKAQSEFTAIPRDAANPFFKSKYASLASAVEVAAPIVAKNGLSIAQFPSTNERGDTLMTYLLHESGQWIVSEMQLHLVKDDPQSQGSATTYARRYSYMSVLGLVADEDDDGASASRDQRGSSGGRNGLSAAASPSQGAKTSQSVKAPAPVSPELMAETKAVVDKVNASDGRKKQLLGWWGSEGLPKLESMNEPQCRAVIDFCGFLLESVAA